MVTPKKIAKLRKLMKQYNGNGGGLDDKDLSTVMNALPDLLDAAEELARIARFILDHPYAARGMGDKCHGDWLKLQEMAHAVVEEATK